MSSVQDVTGLLGSVKPRSPAVIVIGEVVRVSAWEDMGMVGQSDLARTVADLAT